VREISLTPADGEALAWLHANGEVVSQEQEGMATRLAVRLSDADWARFRSRQAERA
jgi:GTP-binding protein HflX